MADSDLCRFVILEHDHPFLHWDLLLEDGATLKSWRLLQPITPGVWIDAEPLPDHRAHYLDYEGPVSGGRGSVKRIADGRYSVVSVNIDSHRPRRYQLFNCPLATMARLRCDEADATTEWCFE